MGRIETLNIVEGLDAEIEKLQTLLINNLTWLDVAFGKCERHRVKGDKGIEIYPVVYNSNFSSRDYEDLRPIDVRGNYAFFSVNEPNLIKCEAGMQNEHTTSLSLIFWYNLEKIQGTNNRSNESIRLKVLEVLNKSKQRIKVERTYNDAKNVFQGFTIANNDEDIQYNVHPYGVLRVDFILKWIEQC